MKKHPSYAKIVAKTSTASSPQKIVTIYNPETKKVQVDAPEEVEDNSTARKEKHPYRFPLPPPALPRTASFPISKTQQHRDLLLAPISPPASEHQKSSSSSSSYNSYQPQELLSQYQQNISRTNSNTSSISNFGDQYKRHYNSGSYSTNNANAVDVNAQRKDDIHMKIYPSSPYFHQSHYSSSSFRPFPGEGLSLHHAGIKQVGYLSSASSPEKNDTLVDFFSQPSYQTEELKDNATINKSYDPSSFSRSNFSTQHSRDVTNTSNQSNLGASSNYDDSGNGSFSFSNDRSYDYLADVTADTSIYSASRTEQQDGRPGKTAENVVDTSTELGPPTTSANANAKRARHSSNISDTSLYSFDGLNDLSIFSPPFSSSSLHLHNNNNAASSGAGNAVLPNAARNDEYAFSQQLGRPVDFHHHQRQQRDRDAIPIPLSLIPDLHLDGGDNYHNERNAPGGATDQVNKREIDRADVDAYRPSSLAGELNRQESPTKPQSDLERLRQMFDAQAGNTAANAAGILPSSVQASPVYSRSSAPPAPTPSPSPYPQGIADEDANFPKAVREAYHNVRLLRNEGEETRYLFVSGIPVPQDEQSQSMVNEITEAIKVSQLSSFSPLPC